MLDSPGFNTKIVLGFRSVSSSVVTIGCETAAVDVICETCREGPMEYGLTGCCFSRGTGFGTGSVLSFGLP